MKVRYAFSVRITGEVEFDEEREHRRISEWINDSISADSMIKVDGWTTSIGRPMFIEHVSQNIEAINVKFENQND